MLPQCSALDEGVVNAVTDAARGADKAVHVCWVAPAAGDPLRRKLQAAGLPCHEWAARAARVLARCHSGTPDAQPEPGAAFAAPNDVPDDGWLAPEQVATLLASWGFPMASWRIAGDIEAAVNAAAQLGFPAVLGCWCRHRHRQRAVSS